jgi:ABC-type branched-subunit amino acid transport system ATPase component
MSLRVHQLSKRFGGIVALDQASAEFSPGSVTALVGSNGAGKSTLLALIAGLLAPDSGEITLGEHGERRISGLPPHLIARNGVGLLFQDVRLFHGLSVLENVAVGAQHQPGEQPLRSLIRLRAAREREQAVQAAARQHLKFVGLLEKAALPAGQLSHGEQKLIAIARLLAADAQVLLLDEPTAGVHPERVSPLLERIRRLAEEQRRTVIMVEHNPAVVARTCDRVYRLHAGRISEDAP